MAQRPAGDAERPGDASMTGWFLVGPTASGKTEVAHLLARRTGRGILSADSMLVYRGMDAGTAKPTPAEREGIRYAGLDLADPSESFSAGMYLERARGQLRDRAWPAGPVIVAGGTGLYIRAIIEGLDGNPGPSPELRAWTERLLQEGGVEALQRELACRSPGRLETLADPRNPRRLARALEQVCVGGEVRRSWSARPRGVLAGLRFAPAELNIRIERRARALFESGLIEEAAGLLARGAELSPTARQAIGYREAFDVVGGRCGREEAIERTIVRTRALARRQRTWFRSQADVRWIDIGEGDSAEATARRVQALWSEHGPVPFGF